MIWIVLITQHMPIGSIGTMEVLMDTDTYAYSTQEQCEREGAALAQRWPVVMRDHYITYKCRGLMIR